ncbi:hypothetical protein [Microbacterium foliorum]|uniref:hypothetical protein n=1 Tax=Microbacterium foliorum TaxID=104336 RepID=UPI0028D8A8C0|nr:hypothetical protein [Microbacterium foliorum]
MFDPFTRFMKWRRASSDVHRTAHQSSVFSEDVGNPESPPAAGGLTAPVAALGIRAITSGAERARGLALASESRTAAALTARAEREARQTHRAQWLGRPVIEARLGAAARYDLAHVRLGHLASWMPAAAPLLISAVMVLSDPSVVYSTARRIMDVPEGLPLWAVWNPDILVSLSMAVGLSVVLVTLAIVLGKALATVLFRRALLAHAQEFPELVITERAMPLPAAVVVAALTLPVLAGAVVFLNTIVHQRFSSGVTAAFAGVDSAHGAVTAYITVLPLVVVLLEIVAHHPSFVHARKAHRWSRGFRGLERRDRHRDDRGARRMQRTQRAATSAWVEVADVLLAISLRAAHEYTRAAVEVAAVPAAPVAEFIGVRNPDSLGGVAADVAPVIDVSGRIATGFLTTPVVSNRVARAAAAYRELEAARALPSISALWADARRAAAIAPMQGDRHGLHALASEEMTMASDSRHAVVATPGTPVFDISSTTTDRADGAA